MVPCIYYRLYIDMHAPALEIMLQLTASGVCQSIYEDNRKENQGLRLEWEHGTLDL